MIRAFQLLRAIIVHGTSSELEALPVDSLPMEKVIIISKFNLLKMEIYIVMN